MHDVGLKRTSGILSLGFSFETSKVETIIGDSQSRI